MDGVPLVLLQVGAVCKYSCRSARDIRTAQKGAPRRADREERAEKSAPRRAGREERQKSEAMLKALLRAADDRRE
jgi:hypothetical protein